MKNRKGSAIIIAIVVVTFVSTVVIGSSQIFLNENKQNSQYLDGIQAWYGAYSGLDLLSGSIERNVSKNIDIASSGGTARKLGINASKGSDDTGESLNLTADSSAKFTVNKLGQAKFWLKNIDISGENCPQGNSLYVYLKTSIEGDNGKIINGTSHVRGVWPDTLSDNGINLYSLGKTLTLTPIVNDKFYLGISENNGLPAGCKVTTQWKISSPSGAMARQGGSVWSTATFSGITKTLNR